MRLIDWICGLMLLATASVLIPLAAKAAGVTGESHRAAYMLGPDDSVAVRAVLVPEIPDRPIRIEADGTMNLPLVEGFARAD